MYSIMMGLPVVTCTVAMLPKCVEMTAQQMPGNAFAKSPARTTHF